MKNPPFNLIVIPALNDNYIYLIHWEDEALVIDPSEAYPVKKILSENHWKLKYILNTHHHVDHIGGNEELKKITSSLIVAPKDERIPSIDCFAKEGNLSLGPFTFKILSIPGHTSTHVAYFIEKENLLFPGDALFNGGCGRLFEGTPEQMLSSLNKLSKLPETTQIYCAHEYTIKNMQFAVSLEPNNFQIQKRLKKSILLHEKNKAAVPSSLKDEKDTNPFLRTNVLSLQKNLKMEGASAVEIFSHIRKMRDVF